jgi:hypothetical protein
VALHQAATQSKGFQLTGTLAQESAQTNLDLQAIQNQLLFGGPFQQLRTNGIRGSQTEAPTGPAFNLVNQALQDELGLSGQRQNIAQQSLQQAQASLDPTNQFNLSALGGGGLAQQAQLGLLGSAIPGIQDVQNLGQQLTGGLSDFFSSGGAPSEFQREQIGNIFDAQRDIGRSNLGQGFDEAIRKLQDQATTRGLRFGDTPIQDRGGLLAGEFGRNLTNLESSLGGQEAQALLGQPFQQAQLSGQIQGQGQNQLLNLINAFSQPVSQGFNANQALQGQRQFGQQVSPFGASAAPLQNIAGLLGGGNFANTQPTFSAQGIPQQPSFLRSLGQATAAGIGQAIPDATSAAVTAAFSPSGGGGGGGP